MLEQIDRTPVDKSSWGDGPWQQEPDRLEWEHAGLPFHGVGYDSAQVDVHGGLTYADVCDGSRICHAPKAGEAADVWWFGFDCGHCSDFSPAMHSRLMGRGLPLQYDVPYDHERAVAANTWTVPVYRTLAYVQRETQSLAEQLAAAATKAL